MEGDAGSGGRWRGRRGDEGTHRQEQLCLNQLLSVRSFISSLSPAKPGHQAQRTHLYGSLSPSKAEKIFRASVPPPCLRGSRMLFVLFVPRWKSHTDVGDKRQVIRRKQ